MTISKQKTKKATSTPNTKARVAKRSAKAAPRKVEPAGKRAPAKKPALAPQGRTKTDRILELLKRPGGVTLKELVTATAWKPNSMRGFLSGTIGKKLGMPVESFKTSDGDRYYRLPPSKLSTLIAAEPPRPAAFPSSNLSPPQRESSPP